MIFSIFILISPLFQCTFEINIVIFINFTQFFSSFLSIITSCLLSFSFFWKGLPYISLDSRVIILWLCSLIWFLPFFSLLSSILFYQLNNFFFIHLFIFWLILILKVLFWWIAYSVIFQFLIEFLYKIWIWWFLKILSFLFIYVEETEYLTFLIPSFSYQIGYKFGFL